MDQIFPDKVGYNAVSFQPTSPEMAHMMNCYYFDNSKFLFNNDFFRYEVSSVNDLDPILEEHLEYMEKVGFPYFEKMSDLESIYNFLSSFILEDDDSKFFIDQKRKILSEFFQDRESYSVLIAANLINKSTCRELNDRLQWYWQGTLIAEGLSKINTYFETKRV